MPRRINFFFWFRENRQAVIDLIFLVFFSIVMGVVITNLDIVEKFFEFSHQHESWELDNFFFVTLTLFSISLTVFSTRRWREVNQLLKAANTDILTGLFNRRKGWEVIELEIERARRYNRSLSIVLFDLDHFKSVNDTYGHLVGDQVLNFVANLVLKNLRSSDILIRWGGEEFLIVCAETVHTGALHLAERLRKIIEGATIPHVGYMTASFGVADLKNKDAFNDLFSRADACLYTAKTSGRNTVV